MIEAALAAMDRFDLEVLINLYASFHRIYRELEKGGDRRRQFDDSGVRFSDARYFGDSTMSREQQNRIRGRQARVMPGPWTADGKPPALPLSTTLGIVGDYDAVSPPVPEHMKGGVVWQPGDPSGSEFMREALDGQYLFVAGPSGSTVEQMQIARTFAQLDGESLKQFTLAVAATMIAGGHHCYHEVMVAAHAAGCPYTPGKYLNSLPTSFLGTAEFLGWDGEYYDIVHWTDEALAHAKRRDNPERVSPLPSARMI